MSMATLTAAAARIADNFLPDGQFLAKEQKAGIVIGLVVITLLSNACGVKVRSEVGDINLELTCSQTYGRLERVVKWFKILLIIGLCILMIMVNLGRKSLSIHALVELFLTSLFKVRGKYIGSSSQYRGDLEAVDIL